MLRIVRMTAAPAALLLCNVALADCDEVRKLTPKEIEYDRRVTAALLEALGPAPAKWTLSKAHPSEPNDVCGAPREGGFSISVSGTYTYQPTKEESGKADAEDRKLQKEIENLRELPADVKKERQVWLDKMSEANRASRQAEKEGNKQLARDKSRDADGYSQKAREIRDRYWASIQPKVDALEARRKATHVSAFVKVKLVANPSSYVRRDPGPGEQFAVGTTPVEKPGLKVQGVLVMLESAGVEARRADIVPVIDREKLKRLLQ